jgi:hypothetical protein
LAVEAEFKEVRVADDFERALRQGHYLADYFSGRTVSRHPLSIVIDEVD